tara:strand:- start:2679 stop:2942 length:264 start_codon:yes stop_codon:yes gene_type:complete
VIEHEELEKAKEIIDNPVFNKIFNDTENSYLQEIKTMPLDDKEALQLMVQAVHVLNEIRSHLNLVSQGRNLKTEDFKRLKNGRRSKK